MIAPFASVAGAVMIGVFLPRTDESTGRERPSSPWWFADAGRGLRDGKLYRRPGKHGPAM